MKAVAAAALALALAPFAFPQTPTPKLHADAATLTRLSNTRQKMQESFKPMLNNAKVQMAKIAPQCNATFADEWLRRMSLRRNPDEFTNVATAAFEHHFTDPELKEMIVLSKASNENKPAAPSAAVKVKLDTAMPLVQREITSGCSQISSRLGSQIGQDINKEHPGYCQQPPPVKK